ncbi:MAG: CDP-alcohol phosphatidyltransferase family protein [Deltaproteobacteria bacterium]|nr:CDP-alcohol phosphatidyltransferase family protein [Deltaproteobacteria bacterium]
MIKSRFGFALDAPIQRILPFLFRWRLNPNALTVLGLAISLLGAACFAQGEFRWGAAAVALGGLCDLVDGVVARHLGRQTRFGAFLDSSLDRVVDAALLSALAVFYAGEGRAAVAWLACAALLFAVLAPYAKARSDALASAPEGGGAGAGAAAEGAAQRGERVFMERAERILVLLAGALLNLMPLALAAVAVGGAVTSAQRIAAARLRLAE